jgi:hypothetical protein
VVGRWPGVAAYHGTSKVALTTVGVLIQDSLQMETRILYTYNYKIKIDSDACYQNINTRWVIHATGYVHNRMVGRYKTFGQEKSRGTKRLIRRG